MPVGKGGGPGARRDHRAVADRAGDPLRGAGPHVPGREDTRPDRLQQVRVAVGERPAEMARAVGGALPTEQVTGVVDRQHPVCGLGAGIGADHHVDRVAADLLGVATGAAQRHRLNRGAAVDSGDLGLGHHLNPP